MSQHVTERRGECNQHKDSSRQIRTDFNRVRHDGEADVTNVQPARSLLTANLVAAGSVVTTLADRKF